MNQHPDCKACNANAHPQEGAFIKEYNHWILQHYSTPAPTVGWLVCRAKRHSEGLESMNEAEAEEFAQIMVSVPKALKEVTGAARTYAVCFGEAVPHLHFAFIARHTDEEFKGPKIFEHERMMKEDPAQAADAAECKRVSAAIRERLD